MNYDISDKDKRDWDTFVKGEEKIFDKDLKKNNSVIEERSIDLHGATLEQANEIVESFINNSFKDGVRKLIVVTGKGLHSKNEADPFVSKDLSILKYSVPEFIKNNELLMKKIIEIKEASAKDGGSGAFYIFLKNQDKLVFLIMFIWLASYPKSGNTLLRSMIAAYFFSKEGIYNFDLIKNIKQFPNITLFERLGIDVKNEKEVVKNYIKVQESFNKKFSPVFENA